MSTIEVLQILRILLSSLLCLLATRPSYQFGCQATLATLWYIVRIDLMDLLATMFQGILIFPGSTECELLWFQTRSETVLFVLSS